MPAAGAPRVDQPRAAPGPIAPRAPKQARSQGRRRRRAEVDVMALFQRMYGSATPHAPAPRRRRRCRQMPVPMPAAMRRDGAGRGRTLPRIQRAADRHAAAAAVRSRRCAPTPSGYVPGAPIIATPDLHEGLTRLQAGETGFRRRRRAGRVLGHPAGHCTTSCATCRSRRSARRRTSSSR